MERYSRFRGAILLKRSNTKKLKERGQLVKSGQVKTLYGK